MDHAMKYVQPITTAMMSTVWLYITVTRTNELVNLKQTNKYHTIATDNKLCVCVAVNGRLTVGPT